MGHLLESCFFVPESWDSNLTKCGINVNVNSQDEFVGNSLVNNNC